MMRRHLANGKLMHSFLEYRAESRNCSQRKQHVFGERKTHAQLLGNAVLRAEIVPDRRSMHLVNGKLTHSFLECRTESRNCSRLKEHMFGKQKTHAQPPGMQN
jgi:hypothetical protein